MNDDNELLMKALIDKNVDLGKSVSEIKEILRRQPDLSILSGELLKALEEIKANQDNPGGDKDQREALLKAISGYLNKWYAESAPDRKEVADLRRDLVQLKEFFERPVRKEMHHKHFLGNAFWVLLAMSVCLGMTSAFGVWKWMELGRYEKNDIKWRYVSMVFDDANRSFRHSIDSTYDANPAEFRNKVEKQEQTRKDLGESLIKQEQNTNHINELEKQRQKFK